MFRKKFIRSNPIRVVTKGHLCIRCIAIQIHAFQLFSFPFNTNVVTLPRFWVPRCVIRDGDIIDLGQLVAYVGIAPRRLRRSEGGGGGIRVRLFRRPIPDHVIRVGVRFPEVRVVLPRELSQLVVGIAHLLHAVFLYRRDVPRVVVRILEHPPAPDGHRRHERRRLRRRLPVAVRIAFARYRVRRPVAARACRRFACQTLQRIVRVRRHNVAVPLHRFDGFRRAVIGVGICVRRASVE